jgi:arylsulfatase
VRNRSHAVVVDVEIEAGRAAEGVLLAQGSVLGGWTFFLVDGTLRYEHNVVGKVRHVVSSDVKVPAGRHRLAFAFEKTAEFKGIGRLHLDESLVGEAEIPFVTPARLSITGAGLSCGYEVGPAISASYVAPFPFTGKIHRAFVDVSGRPYRDLVAEVAAILAAQ